MQESADFSLMTYNNSTVTKVTKYLLKLIQIILPTYSTIMYVHKFVL